MINTDKAYIFGLIIGGGSFGTSKKSFAINLPYDVWGDISKNPARAAKIGQDILGVIAPTMQNNYGLSTSYSNTDAKWQILITGDFQKLQDDLKSYNIDLYKDMRKSADISALCSSLTNDVLKRRFIAGLADTIGSTSPSHRRFNDDVQIVSFEFSGFNYKLVFDICKLFASTGCYADQILWNHPNMHSGSNPYYTSWKKGFKLRIALDAYTDGMGFAFRSKAMSAKENQSKEKKGKVISVPCKDKPITPHCSVVHPAENFYGLPEEIRGGHYIHHKHFCAVLGCPYAPYEEIKARLNNIGEYISPFPILFKGSISDVENKISSDNFLKNRSYSYFEVTLNCFLEYTRRGEDALIYGDRDNNGYPVGKILDAINYIIQKRLGTLKNDRTTGSREETISSYLNNHPDFKITIGRPDFVSVLIIKDSDFDGSCMIGAKNPDVYEKLVSHDSNNWYKIYVRQIKDSDF